VPLPCFNYLAPQSLKEACALLAEHGDQARLMAGGTDLLIRLNHRVTSPSYVIGLKNIPGLDYVRYDREKGLAVGALALLSSVAEHRDVQRLYPALAHAAGVTATVQVRNMGTIVGNLCNAAPSADNAAPLLVYDAQVVIVHPGGERTLPLSEFFRGPGLTALERGEIVKEVLVPPPLPRTGSEYQKLSARSKVDIAAVGAAALVTLDESALCTRARLALGAVAPIPLRVRPVEKMLEGRTLGPELIAQAAALAAQESSPITDVRASAPYRRRMVEVLTARALEKSLSLAGRTPTECDL